jgi:hypothetical protein
MFKILFLSKNDGRKLEMEYIQEREEFLRKVRKIEKNSSSVEEAIEKTLKLLDSSEYYVSTKPSGINFAFMLRSRYDELKNF